MFSGWMGRERVFSTAAHRWAARILPNQWRCKEIANSMNLGDVLVIDDAIDRSLVLSRKHYSPLVAGIYSTKPGVLATPSTMDDPEIKAEVPLAIVGIVPCKVTAENGPITRG